MTPQAADQHGTSLETLCADLAADRHVIVASNRGPVTFSDSGNGNLSGSNFSAGSLSPLHGKLPLTWISAAASPGDRLAVQHAEGGLITEHVPDDWAVRFVTPSRREMHRFYNIICNPLLWFLHHRSWGFTHTPNIDREAHVAWERGMVTVSEQFAKEIVAEAERAERPVAVLLSGYHMDLVAGMVRKLVSNALVHYMIDVPWPGPDDWRVLPEKWRTDIFSSLLECDAVSLSSKVDARQLMNCFEEFAPDSEIDRESKQVVAPGGKKLRMTVSPPSVDSESLIEIAGSDRSQTYAERFSEDDRFTFVTAERAEPYRNIVRCIRAYGSLLDRDRSLTEEMRYLLVLAPPPPHLSQYRRYVREIEQAVSEVNRRHKTDNGKAVELFTENNYPMALGAIKIADAVVSVPISDASCATVIAAPLINERNCTLLLSEEASVAELLKDAASIISPADVETLANDMLAAFEMSEEDAERKFAEAQSVAAGLDHESALTGQLRELLSISG